MAPHGESHGATTARGTCRGPQQQLWPQHRVPAMLGSCTVTAEQHLMQLDTPKPGSPSVPRPKFPEIC